MSTLTRKQSPFEQFIRAQDPSKTIDHDTWHSCAVGDFHRETNTPEEVMLAYDSQSSGQFSICIDPMDSFLIPRECNDGLSHISFKNMLGGPRDVLNAKWFAKVQTYGGLVELLDLCEYRGS